MGFAETNERTRIYIHLSVLLKLIMMLDNYDFVLNAGHLLNTC